MNKNTNDANANFDIKKDILHTKPTTNTNMTTNKDHDKPQLWETFVDTFASSIEFYSRLNSAFIDALYVPFTDAREEIKEIKMQALDGDGSSVKGFPFVNTNY